MKVTKGKNGLPVYELGFALEGLVDDPNLPIDFQVPIPPVTHVKFLRDYLTTDDLITVVEVCGDVEQLATSTALQFKVVRALLPRMTDLPAELVGIIRAEDFKELVQVMAPFLKI